MLRFRPKLRPPFYYFREGHRASQHKFNFICTLVNHDVPWRINCEEINSLINLNGTEVKWEDEDQVEYAVRCELFDSGLIEFAFNNWNPFTKAGTLTIEAQSKDLTMPSGAVNRGHQQNFDVYSPP